MTHAEQIMQQALQRILAEASQKSHSCNRCREIKRLADDALTYAWDDEKPSPPED